MSIFNTAVEKPITTLMIFVGIIVLGVFSLVQLPVDQYPKMDPPYLSVMTSYPGANAADIETNITKILEDQLNSVEDLKELTSTSYDNLSVIQLEFEWEANLDEAANDVRDAIDKAMDNLPDDIDRPSLFKFNTSMMPVIIYSLTADASYPGIEKIVDDKVINRLNRVDGVASVTIAGSPKRVIYVDLDPNKLDAYNMTVESLGNLIAAENKNLPAGNLKMGIMDYQVRVEGEFDDSEKIKNIVVATNNGKSILLKDIAIVKDTIKDITLEQLINRQQGAILLVTKQSDANTVAIAKTVKKEMAQIMKELPPDIKIDVLVDSSDFIVQSINNLSETLMYALIFVVLVVLLFLGRWRATFIIALTIPISLIVAFIYLFITNESLNVISLSSLSIAIGMVVDDAIVVLENITKHIERGSAPREAAKYGTNEVWLSVIVTTLVTVAVFFPLTLVTGMTGILFKQLGYIVCITVCTSTVTAISLTPMLSSQLLRLQDKDTQKKESKFSYNSTVMRLLDKLDAWYERLIRWSLYHKTTITLTAVVIFVASMFLAKYISTDFMPQNDQGSMNVYVKMQTGQRVEETKRVALQIDSIMRANYPEIRQINLSYGSEDEDAGFSSLFNKTGSNILNIRARLVDLKDRNRSVFTIADDLRSRLKELPDVLVYTVSTSSGGSMSSNNVDIEISGFDFEQTNKLAATIKQKMEDVPGAEDINISRDDDKPELQLFLNQDKLSRHGLTTTEVANALRNRVYGYKPTKYKEDGEEYDVIVRLQEKYRSSITEIENILITNAAGEKIRLKELGEIKEYWSPPNIERKSKQRLVKVSITPSRGVSLGDIAVAAQKVIDDMKNEIPQEISVYVGGSYEDQQESFSSLAMLMVLAMLLVYIVMASEFESFKMPFIIMLSIPFAFSGVILALLLTNTTMSVIAALGAVMLVGIVTKNGIVLIDFINLMRERGIRLYDAIAQACRSRLRPVLMTALTTILGMLPMALSTGEGSETWRPMGVAVIGGLVFSTIITMIIVPVIYAAMDKSGSRDKKKALSKQFKFMRDFDPKELEQK
ncbi:MULTISPECIES: efflux RND transporter permease subunit [Porphyromonadaceae]|uniref:Multidrug transporter AcrB n=1 Tax=Sanguibacteroides justesenii TaxID=1547597 RepID=A0A0C3NE75_9PORP|nr:MULTISPECIES: efflux RND transporter permease subunit [Porphyromonadaceae]KIO44412.1 multidrug transporter AcrB [Sanguibacteroides justesenii]KIO45332.1 multidrug transporter AcrB [Sanguibacteroides justesenii]PXZ44618.1 AcrB/AcrD/AcrF family protein [Sanguibacteroides justesenii]